MSEHEFKIETKATYRGFAVPEDYLSDWVDFAVIDAFKEGVDLALDNTPEDTPFTPLVPPLTPESFERFKPNANATVWDLKDDEGVEGDWILMESTGEVLFRVGAKIRMSVTSYEELNSGAFFIKERIFIDRDQLRVDNPTDWL